MAISKRKQDLPKWRYAFNCKDCVHIQTISDGVREGDYCMRSVTLEHDPIHADDDRVVRCDEYVSRVSRKEREPGRDPAKRARLGEDEQRIGANAPLQTQGRGAERSL